MMIDYSVTFRDRIAHRIISATLKVVASPSYAVLFRHAVRFGMKDAVVTVKGQNVVTMEGRRG